MNLGTLDLVSIVPWEIITQLINLLLLFLLLKHFLFKPVQNILNARQAEIDKSYADAETAQTRAEELRDEYEKRISDAKAEAADIAKAAAARHRRIMTKSWERRRLMPAACARRQRRRSSRKRRRP